MFGYLRQQWKDVRLSGKLNKTLTIKGETIGQMWLPDPFCYNARDSNLMQPDSEVHSKVSIDVHGNVHYTKGFVPFNFRKRQKIWRVVSVKVE